MRCLGNRAKACRHLSTSCQGGDSGTRFRVQTPRDSRSKKQSVSGRYSIPGCAGRQAIGSLTMEGLLSRQGTSASERTHWSWSLTMRTLAISALLISGTLLCAAQTGQEPQTFFKQSMGLQDDQIAAIQQGKAVTKVLSTKTPEEVAVFGAIYINASPEDYLKAAQNVEALRKSPNYLGVRKFSSPPQLSDLEGFTLDEDDIKDLKNCKPGACELQLPAESIEAFNGR